MLDGLPVKLIFLKDLSVEDGDFVEHGETFADNAFLKASYYAEKTGLPTIGEDSGILIDAFPGELGVKTRRWGAGEKASDGEWLEYFMKRMEGIEGRGAKFVCNACFVDGGGRASYEGGTLGDITLEVEGPILEGIPLSAVFKPRGFEKVYSALTAGEKNSISHRGKALSEMRGFLEERFC